MLIVTNSYARSEMDVHFLLMRVYVLLDMHGLDRCGTFFVFCLDSPQTLRKS